ncbi:MAG TPA: dihydroorotate dehydrogenase electron transfer subunit [Acetivibrio sp.]|jgi:dihydroorotate dehydrogenase electron transfer subunit|nr:dihydroorotate dehydrogenase electron transfer subunit [Clostridium sp.]HOQ37816.1 dihydroorotate dehydrogenase electron transfer subunit [Acetivibrio sp.]
MSRILTEKVVSVKELAKNIYKMTVQSEYISMNAVPGRFVNVKCCCGIDALLRRPISICNVDKDGGSFDIVFQVKGKGTEYLSQKKAGDEVDLIGPLGNSFEINKDNKRIAVVGGGIGIFPLLYLLKELKGVDRSSYLGFRSSDYVVLLEEFGAESEALSVSTDDGSRGYKGLVTDLLERDIEEKGFDIIYACGPTPMLKKVSEISKKTGIPCQVSLEQRMGCGIGACLVCACKIGNPDNWDYKHVCKDGPVFWSDEVIFDD